MAMYVVKRDGRQEPVHFDKITARINKLAYGLNQDFVDPAYITQKVIKGVYAGVTTVQLDTLAAETAAYLTTEHPDYSILAARIAVSNLHKQTEKCFSAVMHALYNCVDASSGRHAPLLSTDVYNIIMEDKEELDRFCDAMIAIHAEAKRVQSGDWPADDNPLVNAPHPASEATADEWTHPYTRDEAVFPEAWDREDKYWPPVSRIDGVHGDRNLMCSCPPIEDLAQA